MDKNIKWWLFFPVLCCSFFEILFFMNYSIPFSGEDKGVLKCGGKAVYEKTCKIKN